MAAELSLEWSSRDLKMWGDRGVEKALTRAVTKAGGDAIRTLRTESVRQVRMVKRIKAGAVRKALPTYFPKGRTLDELEWVMRASGKAIPLSAFKYTEVKRKLIGRKGRKEIARGGGVRVALNTTGAKTFISGAFVAKMKSGHVGIFRRRGPGRLPIDEAFGPTVAVLFKNVGFVSTVFGAASRKFGESFNRLLPIELGKLKTEH